LAGKKFRYKDKSQSITAKHLFRSQHWVVVKGTANLEIDGDITILQKNNSIFVSLSLLGQNTNHQIPMIIYFNLLKFKVTPT